MSLRPKNSTSPGHQDTGDVQNNPSCRPRRQHPSQNQTNRFERWLNSWVISSISCANIKSLKTRFGKASPSTSKALETTECEAQPGVACLLKINRNLCPGAFHFGKTEMEPICHEDRGTHVSERGWSVSSNRGICAMPWSACYTSKEAASCQIMLGSGQPLPWLKSNNLQVCSNTNFGHIKARQYKLWSITDTNSPYNFCSINLLPGKWEFPLIT